MQIPGYSFKGLVCLIAGLFFFMFIMNASGNQHLASRKEFSKNSGSTEDSQVRIKVRNIAGGNPLVPGSKGIAYLSGSQHSSQGSTTEGVVIFDDIPPANDYSLRVEVQSVSEAFNNPAEYWGVLKDVEIGLNDTSLVFIRHMPYVSGISALETANFAPLSALQAGVPVSIKVHIENPSSQKVSLDVLLKLHNNHNDSIFLLQQPAVIEAGKGMQAEFNFTPEMSGVYYFAPALKLKEPEGDFTDCWDWSEQPLFSVVKQLRVIEFAGYKFYVKAGFAPPGPNMWSNDPGHVWVDNNGGLTLTLTPGSKHWLATEVVSEEFFGYGTYTFYLKTDPNGFDPEMVGAIFLYRDGENEIDIELTRWGNPLNNYVGNYVLQPANNPGNQFVFPMDLKGTYSTHRIIWLPDKISFESWHGHHSEPNSTNIIAQWDYSGNNIPKDYQMRLHLNFWLFRGAPPLSKKTKEFKISGFTFQPL